MKKEKVQKSIYENFLSYDIHVGGLEKNLNYATKAYVQEYVENRCVFDMTHTYVSLHRVQQYIHYMHEHEKKILFIGTPKHLKKELFNLCVKYKHYCVDTWFYGLFTNFSRAYQKKRKSLLHISERPSLIFVFDLSQYKEVKKEALRLEIPIMAFISTDDNIENIDYPIVGNVKSVKGGMFVLNFFSEVLKVAEEAQEKRKKALEEAKKQHQLLKLKRKLILKLERERRKRNAAIARRNFRGKNRGPKNFQKGKKEWQGQKKKDWQGQKKTFSPHKNPEDKVFQKRTLYGKPPIEKGLNEKNPRNKTPKVTKSFRTESQQVKKN